MRIDKILTIPIPAYRFDFYFDFCGSRKPMWAAQDFTPTEANVSSASSTPLVLIGDNKLAHIKLPAMAAGGAGGNSSKTYSFKVVLLGEAAWARRRWYCEYKFNDKHITTLQVLPVEPLAPRLTDDLKTKTVLERKDNNASQEELFHHQSHSPQSEVIQKANMFAAVWINNGTGNR